MEASDEDCSGYCRGGAMSTLTPTKIIPVARPSIGVEEEKAVLEVLRSGWLAQGTRVAEFEKRFAGYVGAAHAVAVSSCTTALHLTLLSAGVRPGDEVLCPSLSFIATANSIRYAGAFPVFVDINPATYNMDPECVERAITPRTRAIMVVHQIGLPVALREILEIATRHGLVVVEDAACAIGSEYNHQRIGLPHSAMACFSFHPRKILTTGEGGMITTANEELAVRIRKLRQHAMTVSDLTRHSSTKVVTESYDEVGYNYRMTDLQAALGIVQLQRLDDMLGRRRRLASRYSEHLSQVDWLVPPAEPTDCRHNFQSYMVRLNRDSPIGRDELMQELLNRGISTRRGIMAIHREAPYREAKWDNRLPQTEYITDNTIILPLFHTMTDEEQNHVIDCIAHVRL
jgi:dTDP-4-amino-4,6-dideoxygalactose transaminase